MNIEIERKFLVKNGQWKGLIKSPPLLYVQAYLNTAPCSTVRVRVINNSGYITVKSGNVGMSRKEFEYDIPHADAKELIALCPNLAIEKYRYRIEWGGKLWEVDEFTGGNKGLVLAEVELDSESEHISVPPWVEEEVTGDNRFYNAYLYQKPFTTW